MLNKNIGKMIQKAREDAGLSQEELASRLGCTQAALSNYELGKRRLYLANIEQIAKVLNKPLGYFLENQVERSRTKSGPSQDKVIAEINRLLAEFSAEELANVLEYVQWRKERLK
jgi:transcriptional regulator with XRE-family HTH domain